MGHCFLRCAKRSRTENSPLSSHSFLPPPPLHQTGCAPQSSLVLPRHQNTGKPPVAALLRRRLRLRTTPLPVWHQKPMQVGRQVRRCSGGGGGGEQCLISFLSLLLLLFPFSYLRIVCCLWTKGRENRRGDMPRFGGGLGGQFEKVRSYFAKWKYRHVLHGFAHKLR